MRHQILNSLSHAIIFFVFTVKLVRYVDAREVVKVCLMFSCGTLARHDPLSRQTLPS